ncbi:universal stress protein [Mesorhizobium erdmanii]|uniref:universal stress protein n=1 Tax=Mesorhizobium erdmanii TaxID=1777866 RepID=UPI00047CD151|nr:universal stress protein [Mesorhizobium erdmanii]
MYKHLLIATDGSEFAHRGVEHGLSLASRLKATVTFLNVTEPFPMFDWGSPMAGYSAGAEFTSYEEEGCRFARQILDQCKAAAAGLRVDAKAVHVENRKPAEAILELSKAEGCDLIVMASHGRRGLARLLGSQATEVLSFSTVPVLIVR